MTAFGSWSKQGKTENRSVDEGNCSRDELRKSFGHDPDKWETFKKEYRRELEDKSELINTIKQLEEKQETITLIYAAKDKKHNNAVVLLELLNKREDI